MKDHWNNRILKKVRRWLPRATDVRTKHGAALALDILQANGIPHLTIPDANGSQIRLSTSDKVVSAAVIQDGEYSFDIMRVFTTKLREQGLEPAQLMLVNAGANIGTTLINAHRCGFRHLVAIEPDPSNFDILKCNASQLPDVEIDLKNIAVGATEGKMTLYKHPTNFGKHSLIAPQSNVSDHAEATSVSVRPLDAILDPATSFVLFADTEGYEPQLLDGARAAIAQGCQAICLELTPAHYDPATAKTLSEILSDFAQASYFDVQSQTGSPMTTLEDRLLQRDAAQFDAIFLRRTP